MTDKRRESLRAASKRLYYKHKAAGLCVACGEPRSDSRVRCEACCEWGRKRFKERTVRLRSAGLCVWCGMPANGKSLCPSCMQKGAQRNAAQRAKKAEVGG